VIADAVRVLVVPREFLTHDLFAQLDRLDHRGIAEAATADVVDVSDPRGSKELVGRSRLRSSLRSVPSGRGTRPSVRPDGRRSALLPSRRMAAQLSGMGSWQSGVAGGPCVGTRG
jgi:hypothetical protein